MNSPAARKTQLRRELRARRKSIPDWITRSAQRRAARHALKFLLARKAARVGVYLAMGSELDTQGLIRALRAAEIEVLVPLVDAHADGRMRFVRLAPGAALRRRRFGILEPVSRRQPRPVAPDVLILPLLGFDPQGTRLGSGAGYYDRWLARQYRGPLCVAYAYSTQETATLPREPWDRPLDAVCTERGLRRFSHR